MAESTRNPSTLILKDSRELAADSPIQPCACATCTSNLQQAYGPQHWWPARTPFEVILGAYLTQNTAWKAVERSLANLRAAGALTLDGLRAVPLAKLRRLIRPSGFITRKAPALKAFVTCSTKSLAARSKLSPQRPRLSCASAFWLCPASAPRPPMPSSSMRSGHPVPVADEYLRRIAERHGLLAPPPGRSRISYDALADLTRQRLRLRSRIRHAQLFNEFHALTVAVGKAHCGRTARCDGLPVFAAAIFARARVDGSRRSRPPQLHPSRRNLAS